MYKKTPPMKQTAIRATEALKPSVSLRGLMAGWKTNMPSTRPSVRMRVPTVSVNRGRGEG
jgi:hypothetical protein